MQRGERNNNVYSKEEKADLQYRIPSFNPFFFPYMLCFHLFSIPFQKIWRVILMKLLFQIIQYLTSLFQGYIQIFCLLFQNYTAFMQNFPSKAACLFQKVYNRRNKYPPEGAQHPSSCPDDSLGDPDHQRTNRTVVEQKSDSFPNQNENTNLPVVGGEHIKKGGSGADHRKEQVLGEYRERWMRQGDPEDAE
nr:hypothetical protein [Anaerotruncus sp. G3(2012)]